MTSLEDKVQKLENPGWCSPVKALPYGKTGAGTEKVCEECSGWYIGAFDVPVNGKYTDCLYKCLADKDCNYFDYSTKFGKCHMHYRNNQVTKDYDAGIAENERGFFVDKSCFQ